MRNCGKRFAEVRHDVGGEIDGHPKFRGDGLDFSLGTSAQSKRVAVHPWVRRAGVMGGRIMVSSEQRESYSARVNGYLSAGLYIQTARPILLAVLCSGVLFGGPLEAEDLTLAEDETRVLSAGTHNFDLIQMGRNSTILLSGTTRLTARKMTTDVAARIEYDKGEDLQNNAKYLEFVVLDGSGMRGRLLINGSGADADHGVHGSNGRHGDSEHTKTDTCYKRVVGVRVPYPCIQHVEPEPGGHGGHGGDGSDGEEAMDIDASMYKLDPSVHVTLMSNGGNGGDGGNGGNGGDGGRGKRIERGRNGGNGGNAGNGGDGGDAGDIDVVLVYRDGTPEADLEKLRKFLDNNIHATPGIGGRRGIAGIGGTGGDGGVGGRIGGEDIGIRRGGGRGGSSGSNGRDGGVGDTGAVTKELVEAGEWINRNRGIADQLFR